MDSISQRYSQAYKASKARILDEVCASTGFHRKYAIARIHLVESVRRAKAARPRRREKIYRREVSAGVQ